MRILVCGGRDWINKDVIYQDLDFYYDLAYENNEHVEIISGMARGADLIAWEWAQYNKIKCHEFPADWDKYGKRAGPLRNQKMIDEGFPDLCLAYPTPSSTGTYDMMSRCRQHGIRVIKYEFK